MKVALYSAQPYDREYFDRFNTSFGHEITYIEAGLDAHTAYAAHGHGAVCIFVNDKADRQALSVLREQGVGMLALRCAGFNQVDLQALSDLGMKAARVPAYSPQAVAEHAVALILTLNRKTHKAYNRVREGNFSLDKLMGFDLYGRTVGVIGAGKIGAAFCRIMRGFGCRVLAYDVNPSSALQAEGVQFVGFDDALRQADILSLQCPLTPATRHMINRETLALMKDGAMLINTSRGGLVNTQDVIDALKSHKLGSLGIDVYEQEEHLFFRDLSESIIQDDAFMRLMTFPNVLVTAHQGFFTEEAVSQIASVTLQNIADWEKGLALTNEVRL